MRIFGFHIPCTREPLIEQKKTITPVKVDPKGHSCAGKVTEFMFGVGKSGWNAILNGLNYGSKGAWRGGVLGMFVGGGFSLFQAYGPKTNFVGFCSRNNSTGFRCPVFPSWVPERMQNITESMFEGWKGEYKSDFEFALRTMPVFIGMIGGAAIGGVIGGGYGVVSGLFAKEKTSANNPATGQIIVPKLAPSDRLIAYPLKKE
jgi:hypothetical protein